MDMPSILLKLNENATHKISEELSYSDAQIITDYVKELQDTLNNLTSSSRIMVSSKALEELKSWAYNNVQPHDDECHDIISRL